MKINCELRRLACAVVRSLLLVDSVRYKHKHQNLQKTCKAVNLNLYELYLIIKITICLLKECWLTVMLAVRLPKLLQAFCKPVFN